MDSIRYATASTQDISNILTKIESVCGDDDLQHIFMACITLAILIQNPEIEMTALINQVRDVSEIIALKNIDTTPGQAN
jgi:hypothetical protein